MNTPETMRALKLAVTWKVRYALEEGIFLSAAMHVEHVLMECLVPVSSEERTELMIAATATRKI